MKNIEKIGVIGAGMMGTEIALCFALNHVTVLLKDVSKEMADKGKQRADGILSKWVSKEKITPSDKEAALGRISAQGDYEGFSSLDLVIEAAIEVKAAKADIFKQIDSICNDACIFASNTSSIPITELAATTNRADRFIGMHFFSPASIMKLVEVIPGISTSEDTVRKATDAARTIGKEPVKVKDCAGFLVNRLLFAFFNEAWRAVDEGVASVEDVDKAVKLGLGHPVGIFQMQDLVGLDNAVEVCQTLYKEYGERYHPSPLLSKKVSAGHLGRKVKQGWYSYDK